MNVTLQARGYSERQLPISFGHKTKSFTLRMYRPASQWPMYGVTAHRTQSQTSIRLRPPFKVVWSKGLGSLLEFPAVVSDGVAYIVNYRGTVWALSMRFGSVVWRVNTGAKMASSPAVAGDQVIVHGMDGRIRVFDRSNGKLLWDYAVGSPVESSPVVARRRRLLRLLERRRLRARPEDAPAALDVLVRRQDHVERRRGRARRSTSATTPAACSR